MQEPTLRRRTFLPFALTTVLTALITAGIAYLLVNIFQRKQEARNPYLKLVNVDETTTDPRVWGTNWPRQFDSYSRTVDQTHTRYGGSDGPVPESRIERDPWLKRMFLGYAFSLDFRDRRGHAYMLYDQEQTERIAQRPQSGACLHCHSSVIPTYRRLGLEAVGKTLADAAGFDWPAVMRGFEITCQMTYTQAHAELYKTPDGGMGKPWAPSRLDAPPRETLSATQAALAAHVGNAHPVSCVDCHDPNNMELRITRPGFIQGIAALAASDKPLPHLPSIERWRQGSRSRPYDPNIDAFRQEMRSFACAQCHVEYYCSTKATLFYPWGNGLKAEEIEAFYDDYKFPDGTPFVDFKHAETGAPMLKAQHPEFELWSQGIHARSGVACADCHMPYTREGAMKVSDHWVRSPLLNIARACQPCHQVPETELAARVAVIQDRNHDLMQRAGKAIDALMTAIVSAKSAGIDDARLETARRLHRKAQWRLDFVNAENSMGFHAPQEAARLLAEAIDYARQGEIACRP
ncbi:MAG: ammonia-forming cytochrome c nitrite reductase subunit c552 [Phycisphaerae bacterium]|nr:ammonia-forming cytochrome c nitrite reductase subunit c552 [Phycisphaerae bacterium]MDW8262457.1 ammonia-forming cytochrome c nitrite reductase subunit c552 [Phycisphaerales bacterium]